MLRELRVEQAELAISSHLYLGTLAVLTTVLGGLVGTTSIIGFSASEPSIEVALHCIPSIGVRLHGTQLITD